MPIVLHQGWPLGDVVTCEVCDTQWQVEQGDQQLSVVSPVDGTLTVEVDCPGCNTRYHGVKVLATAKLLGWVKAKDQYNVEDEPEPPAERAVISYKDALLITDDVKCVLRMGDTLSGYSPQSSEDEALLQKMIHVGLMVSGSYVSRDPLSQGWYTTNKGAEALAREGVAE